MPRVGFEPTTPVFERGDCGRRQIPTARTKSDGTAAPGNLSDLSDFRAVTVRSRYTSPHPKLRYRDR
jgi:hypothetical protein